MYNIACPAMASKVLKASNTAHLLIDISSNMRQHTRTLSDIVCTLSLTILNTWAFMPIHNWTVFRRKCNVLLEGRGNRYRKNAYDLGLHFRIETAKTFSLGFHLLPLGSYLLFLSPDAKYLEVPTFEKMKETYKDYCPTGKPFSASLLCTSFSTFQGHSLFSESCYTVFLFLGVNSATLSKTSFVNINCLALRFEELF